MDRFAQTSNVEKIFCASLGAFMTSLVVTPLNVIKTRLQVQKSLNATTALKPFSSHNFSYCGGDVDFSFCQKPPEMPCRVPAQPLVFQGTWVSGRRSGGEKQYRKSPTIDSILTCSGISSILFLCLLVFYRSIS